jgi:hypothetical protein
LTNNLNSVRERSLAMTAQNDKTESQKISPKVSKIDNKSFVGFIINLLAAILFFIDSPKPYVDRLIFNIPYIIVAITLIIRSFVSKTTWLQFCLTWIGGLFFGIAILKYFTTHLAYSVLPVILSIICLYFGFKKKITS